MKNEGNLTPAKAQGPPPGTGPKEIEFRELPDKEFKIILLKILRGLKESTNNHSMVSGKQYKNTMGSSTER